MHTLKLSHTHTRTHADTHMCERCIDCSRDITVCKHGNCEQLSESFIKHTHANTQLHIRTVIHPMLYLKVISGLQLAAAASALNPLSPADSSMNQSAFTRIF